MLEIVRRGALPVDEGLRLVLPLFRQAAAAHERGLVAPLEGLDAVRVEKGVLLFDETRLRPPVLDFRALAAWKAPAYVPGYRCFEHDAGHHDALTDLFCLGQILASLLLGIDMTADDAPRRLLEWRESPLRPGLHPVVVRAMLQMTELDRHHRAQDLGAWVARLERYREVELAEEFDPTAIAGFQQQSLRGKRDLVLAKLRERLFEISRRNRLLHFRRSLATLDLAEASCPLEGEPDRAKLFLWRGDVERAFAEAKPIVLTPRLRFEEALYLPQALDRIRIETSRDEREFGHANLRVAAAFLRWHDLKNAPEERIHTPLALIPVTLAKRRGVRDAWVIEPVAAEAEINPVLRHHLKQLYGIALPETLDLSQTSLSIFHRFLAERIQASEPAVLLRRVDEPDVRLLQRRSRQRLDRFLKEDGPPTPLASTPEPPPNPYEWHFDLSAPTLGNFRYRKMTLVRDYDALVGGETASEAFDSVFSLVPRPVEDAEKPRPLAERFTVVPCDPTQDASIDAARGGRSMIIQGPPGTGKSQTITNLIADYLARGKRVLFMCQKRAAIDVVFHRLRQVGLDRASCLVHDSQSDKKAVIQDLRDTYDGFLSGASGADEAERARAEVQRAIEAELDPLERFDAAMLAPPAGIPTRALLRRLVELRMALGSAFPALPPAELESMPRYPAFAARAAAMRDLRGLLLDHCPEGVLARHPLGRLDPGLAREARPLQAILGHLDAADRESRLLAEALAAAGAPDDLAGAERLLAYAVAARPLAAKGLLGLVASAELDAAIREHRARTAERDEAARSTGLWRERLTPEETAAALAEARAVDGRFLSFLSPRWWRLRGVLRRRYDFDRAVVRPGFVAILEALAREQAASRAVESGARELAARFRWDGPFEDLAGRVESLRAMVADGAAPVAALHARAAASPAGARAVEALADVAPRLAPLRAALAALWPEPLSGPLADLRAALDATRAALDRFSTFFPLLAELEKAPPETARLLRLRDWNLDQLEAASASATLEELYRADPSLARFTGAARARQLDRLADLTKRWREANAAVVLERVRRAFRQRVGESQRGPFEPSPEQQAYAHGRKELEHEFGKTMRHKSIRDLWSGNAGLVLRDLKPVWLMSPLSVSDALPLDPKAFDVLILDEASQVPVEEALPALFRAPQAIVVGDEMQLPPTSFFQARPGEDEELLLEEEGTTVPYELSATSLLNQAQKSLRSTMLGWHYRSRSEALISFSNAAFYGGRLLTVPEEERLDAALGAIDAGGPGSGGPNAEALLRRSVSFHRLDRAVYRERRNPDEAEYVAHLVRALLAVPSRPTLAVVAFSEAQQGEIERALERLARADGEFRERLDAEWEREEEGQFAGLLVKNLENIQGDERDIVILSVCYGRGPDGRMRMNFGPINQAGGEKRLNVAFSRSKRHMAVVTSIGGEAITNSWNDGANALRNYLRYAAAISAGDPKGARQVLRELQLAQGIRAEEPARDAVLDEVARALEERGWRVDRNVGQSHFRCDLAPYREGDRAYRAGILVDTDAHYARGEILERDLARPRLLRDFGWRIFPLLTKDWWHDRDAVLARLESALSEPV